MFGSIGTSLIEFLRSNSLPPDSSHPTPVEKPQNVFPRHYTTGLSPSASPSDRSPSVYPSIITANTGAVMTAVRQTSAGPCYPLKILHRINIVGKDTYPLLRTSDGALHRVPGTILAAYNDTFVRLLRRPQIISNDTRLIDISPATSSGLTFLLLLLIPDTLILHLPPTDQSEERFFVVLCNALQLADELGLTSIRPLCGRSETLYCQNPLLKYAILVLCQAASDFTIAIALRATLFYPRDSLSASIPNFLRHHTPRTLIDLHDLHEKWRVEMHKLEKGMMINLQLAPHADCEKNPCVVLKQYGTFAEATHAITEKLFADLVNAKDWCIWIQRDYRWYRKYIGKRLKCTRCSNRVKNRILNATRKCRRLLFEGIAELEDETSGD